MKKEYMYDIYAYSKRDTDPPEESFKLTILTEPKVGEIRKAKDIGFSYYGKYIWHSCEDCGKARWVRFRKGTPKNRLCIKCSSKGERSGAWKGGRSSNHFYVTVYLNRSDFFRPMADKRGFVLEHRLVMAKHLNRCLLPWEIVHHKNGDKKDNSIENLELIGCSGKHNTMVNRYIKELERENNKLRLKISKLEEGLKG